MLHHQAIIGNRAIIIRQTFIDCETDFHIEYRPINAKTGKPWQASRIIVRLQDTSKAKAMRAWLYECANVRKAA
jgi:hypothetical protein